MGNREKGEFDIEIAGKTYTTVLTTNAMVALEDLFSTPDKDVTFDQIMRKVNTGSVKYMRAFVWAALQEHHPELTVKATGDLIQAAGGIIAFGQQLEKLAGSTVPGAADVQTLGVGAEANPLKAQSPKPAGRGTGPRSIPTAAASA